jgi:hypothetical protein
MEYKVVRNFSHDKDDFLIGDIYKGDKSEELLSQGLLSPIINLAKVIEESRSVPYEEPVFESKKDKKKGK